MGSYRKCVPDSRVRLLPSGAGSSQLQAFLTQVCDFIPAGSPLFPALYVPMQVREYADLDYTARLWVLPPTRPTESSILEPVLGGLANQLASLARSGLHRVLFLIGPMGAGKSTFIQNLMFQEIPSVGSDLIPLVADGLSFDESDDLAIFLVEEFKKVLADRIPKYFDAPDDDAARQNLLPLQIRAFAQQMRLDNVPTTLDGLTDANEQKAWLEKKRDGDPLKFWHQCMLKAADLEKIKMHPIVAIDNLDQHLGLFGDKLLSNSVAAARKLEASVLVSLRDTSFRVNNPSFPRASIPSGGHFHLDPAQSSAIMKKRLGLLRNRTIPDRNLQGYVQQLLAKFGSEQDEVARSGLVKLLEAWAEPLANYNKRRIFDILKAIILSPHTARDSFDRGVITPQDDFRLAEDYRLPTKVKMAMITGRYNYYNDNATDSIFVLNLFDTGQASQPWQSLFRFKLLQHLVNKTGTGIILRDLFAKCKESLPKSGEGHIAATIAKFVQVGLATLIDEGDSYETATLEEPLIANIDRYMDRRTHVTPNGLHHFQQLIRDGIYLDEMRMRSSVPPEIEGTICNARYIGARTPVLARTAATEAFLKYLRSCDEDAQVKAINRALEVTPVMDDLLANYNQLSKKIRDMVEARRAAHPLTVSRS